jgi:hypothetical protein
MHLSTKKVIDRLIDDYRIDHGPTQDEEVLTLRRRVASLQDEIDYLNEHHCSCMECG